MMKRRDFLRHAGGSAASLVLSQSGSGCARRTERPNILFAISDDQSWPHAGAYGCDFVNTPAFDRIAREGALFANGFCPAPQCSPCRAALLTGRNIWQNEEAGTHQSYFPTKFTVFTDLLAEAGYLVGCTGKAWGPGNWEDSGWSQNPAGRVYDARKNETPFDEMNDTDYAGNFEDFLNDRDPAQPFCFWYGSGEPHRDYEEGVGRRSGKEIEQVTVPEFLPDNDVVRSDMLDYAVEIEWFDTHLERVIAKLEQIGELDNTLIVVTGDNGMPFPRAKANLYEYGTHMPLAMRWGNVIRTGRQIDDPVSFIDFAPTFLAAAGHPVPSGMTGRSLLPVLQSHSSGYIDESRTYVLTGRERHTHARADNLGYPARAIRSRTHLYVWNMKPDRWPAGDPEGFFDIDGSPSKDWILAHRTDPVESRYFELACGLRPEEELFDIRQDPACLQNLAATPGHAALRQALRAQLEEELRRQEDPRILGYGDIFDSYPRFSNMRPELLPGFAERGQYHPQYAERARAALERIGR
ncbi:sulfatase [Gemmatimonadota bacterium]